MSIDFELEDATVASITQLAMATVDPKPVRELSHPLKEVIAINGRLVELSKNPPVINPILRTPSDLRAYIEQQTSQFINSETAKIASEVLVGESIVVYYPNHRDRREFASTPLTPTPAMTWLKAPSSLRQVDFVRLLRTTLEGTIPDANLLPRVRAVRFSTSGQATGVVKHGAESIDRSMLAQLEDASSLPEELTLNVQVCVQTSIRYPIRCTLDVDPSSQEFKLAPLPTEIWNATTAALAAIAGGLRIEDGPSVYLGEAR